MSGKSSQTDDVFTSKEYRQTEEGIVNSAINRMVYAFQEFHEQMKILEEQQEDVARHIRTRIDQEKIEEIKKTLNQLTQ